MMMNLAYCRLSKTLAEVNDSLQCVHSVKKVKSLCLSDNDLKILINKLFEQTVLQFSQRDHVDLVEHNLIVIYR